MHKNTHKQTLTNKTKISEQKKQKKPNNNNKGNGFLRAQTFKGVKVACFEFNAFCAREIFL